MQGFLQTVKNPLFRAALRFGWERRHPVCNEREARTSLCVIQRILPVVGTVAAIFPISTAARFHNS